MSLSLSLSLTLGAMGRGGGGPTPPVEPLQFATDPEIINAAIQQGDTLAWALGTTTGGDGSPITWSSQVQMFDRDTELWADYGDPVVGESDLEYEFLSPDIWGQSLRVNVTATQGEESISAATDSLTARNGFLDTFEEYTASQKIYPVWSRFTNYGEHTTLSSTPVATARTSAEVQTSGFPAGTQGINHTVTLASGEQYRYGFDVGSADQALKAVTGEGGSTSNAYHPRGSLRAKAGTAYTAGQIEWRPIGANTFDLYIYSGTGSGVTVQYRFTGASDPNNYKNRPILVEVKDDRIDIKTPMVFTSASIVSGSGGTPATNNPAGGAYITSIPVVGTGTYTMIQVSGGGDNPMQWAEYQTYNLNEAIIIDEQATVINGPNDVTLKGTYFGATPAADGGNAAIQIQQEGLQGRVVTAWTNATDIGAADGAWEATITGIEGGADYRFRVRKGNVTSTIGVTSGAVPVPDPMGISVNLTPISRYRPNDVFSNAMLRAEPRDNGAGGGSYDMSAYEPDADRFPTVLPPGHLYSLLLPEYLRTGEWKVFYTPGTTVTFNTNPDAGWTIDSNDSGSGVATITITADSVVNQRVMNITGLPPGGLDLLKMFKSSDIADAGGDYNDVPLITPHWLATHAHYKVIRFMDWMNTNKSAIVNRPTLTSAGLTPATAFTWVPEPTANGMPFEAIVAVCNALQCDAWITPRHDADNSYYDALATAMLALDPGLKIYVEYSNEVWNFGVGFQQTNDIANRGLANGEGYPIPGDPGSGEQNTNKARGRQYAIEHLAVLGRFQTIFDEDYDSRIVPVCGAQQGTAVESGLTKYKLEISGYKEAIKHYATAPYLHGDTKTTLTGTDLDDHMFDTVAPAEITERARVVAKDMRWISEQTDSTWKYSSYEGGQHWTAPNSEVGNTEYNTKIAYAYQADARMGLVYDSYIPTVWGRYGGPVCQFTDVEFSWGAARNESATDDPKYVALKNAS